ncbi:DUF7408 domain-containing protein [Gorillibacterium sp. sgz5001074]|uniref:DUF7408 domain-containing protein n=1 Tax=Gorillibacterium sp. sgz5001074 TaxID=3446695 RepID=UPI003F66DE41
MERTFEPAAGRYKRGFVWKTASLAVLAAGLAASWAVPGVAKAETAPLELKVEAGYQGKAKEDRWFPVQITVTNPGSDLSGELAVELASPFNGKDISYHVHVDLPKGSTKSVELALPGMHLNEKNNRVVFYAGDADGGKRIPIQGGNPSITVQQLPVDNYQIGILARDPDTMNYMALLNQRGYSLSTVPLGLGEMFSDAQLLDGLDAIVVNDVAAADWKPEQTAAVKSWVQSGGTLILAGGAAYSKAPASLLELSPVTVSGTGATTHLDALAQAAGKPLKLDNAFTVSSGTLKKEGRALFKEGSLPLIAEGREGLGRVLYVAYDLSQHPLASWQGNADLWEQVLLQEIRATGTFRNGPGPGIFGPAYNEINQQLENFPSMVPPSYRVLMIVLLLYAGLAGPVIYFVLKRLDKREWSWVAIPGLAILVSGGIYLFGASDRSSTMVQALTLSELNGKGQVRETTAVGAFVPKGGTYTLTANGYDHGSPLGSGYNGGGAGLTGDPDIFVTRKTEGSDIKFTGVPYWSVRKAWFYGSKEQEAGSIGYSLTFAGGSPKGEFRNGLKMNLNDVYFYSGSQWYALGDLKAGDTAALDSSKLVGGLAGSHISNLGNTIFPFHGSNDEKSHQRALLQAVIERRQQQMDESFILGFSRSENKTKLAVNGSEQTADEWKLWLQPVQLDRVSGGTAYLPLGKIKPVVITPGTSMKSPDWAGNLPMNQGEAELAYRIPAMDGVVYERLTDKAVYAVSGHERYEIWNEKKQQYEPLDALPDGTELKNYWTGDGRTLKVKLTMRQNGLTRFPDLALEGRAAP